MFIRPLAACVSTLLALTVSATAFAQNPAPAVTPAPAPAAVPMIETPAVKPAPAAAVKSVMPGEPAPNAKPSGPRMSGEESGLAAVYSDKLHGRKTASGKRYDRNALTAAHKTLPFGTKVRVLNTKNKRNVVLTINDRGPVQPERILDISPRAAKALGIHPRGMGDVVMTVVSAKR